MGESQGFEQYRNYLYLLARMEAGKHLQGKVDPSDLVQLTLMEACQKEEQNRGRSEREVMAWLRLILAHHIYDATVAFGRAKRDVRREQAFQQGVDASSQLLGDWLAADQSSPSGQVQRQDDERRLADALAQLPDSQREALYMRYCMGWTLAQIGEQLGCKPSSVVGLLERGSKQLRALLEERR